MLFAFFDGVIFVHRYLFFFLSVTKKGKAVKQEKEMKKVNVSSILTVYLYCFVFWVLLYLLVATSVLPFPCLTLTLMETAAFLNVELRRLELRSSQFLVKFDR